MLTSEFRRELKGLINQFSMESGSDTPDFILAEYLCDCLQAFDKSVSRRGRWYGNEDSIVTPVLSGEVSPAEPDGEQ